MLRQVKNRRRRKKLVPIRPPEAIDPFGGGCPRCGLNDGYLNIGRVHWYRCDEHRVKWCRGENLLSSWRGESEAQWRVNRESLEGYEDAEPIFPPEVPNARDGLSPQVLEAIERILETHMDAEHEDYSEREPSLRPGHIFESFAILDGWLNGIAKPVELHRMWLRARDRERFGS